MKIEIKKIKPKKESIEAKDELKTGVYHAKFGAHDRIILVREWEDAAFVIDHLGTVQSIDRSAILNTYTGIKKISGLKIEYEVEA